MNTNKQPESFITNDPKIFEQLEKTNPIVFAPGDAESAKFNFVRYCTDFDRAAAVAETIVNSILHEERYWKVGEQSLLTGLLLVIADSDDPTPANLFKLLNMEADIIINGLRNSQHRAGRNSAQGFSDFPANIQSGIISGLIQKLCVLNEPDMVKFTDTGDPFDFAQLREQPTQIFWNIERSVFPNPLTPLFFSFALRDLIRNDTGLKVKFLISDLADLGVIKNFQCWITLMKCNNLALQTTGNSFDRLAHLYGRDNATTITENLDALR